MMPRKMQTNEKRDCRDCVDGERGGPLSASGVERSDADVGCPHRRIGARLHGQVDRMDGLDRLKSYLHHCRILN